jgi:16S rRNA (cytosine967-C5)-methyltransferase
LTDNGARLRASAARCVAQVMSGRSLKTALALERVAFADPRDRALLEAIVVDTVRHRRRLESALGHYMQKPLDRRDPGGHSLLLTGLAQLHVLALPAHAAVSETVAAARLLGLGARAGLINAVLRRSQREGLPDSADIAVSESHPDWLIESLATDWPDDWCGIVRANNRIAPLWLRVNGTRGERAAVADSLREMGIEFHLPDSPRNAVLVQHAIAPTRLPGWDAGDITVQDLSAQLAAEALSPEPGETVWDMCAAPGGKSAQLAEARPAAMLLTDTEPARIDKIRELFQRLGLQHAGVILQAWDATQPLPAAWPQAFDAILLDAPCSATGIIRRQPDVKWHRQAKDIGRLNVLQWRLLKNAWRHLKPGGRLLYSTCSVLKAENADLIGQFLGQHDDAAVLPLSERFGRVSGAGRQRFPGDDDGDGFFYALLERK